MIRSAVIGATSGLVALPVAALAFFTFLFLSALLPLPVMFVVGYLSLFAPYLVGGFAASRIWRPVARRMSSEDPPSASRFLLSAALVTAVAFVHSVASGNPIGFTHTWGNLYGPWVFVLFCAAVFARLMPKP